LSQLTATDAARILIDRHERRVGDLLCGDERLTLSVLRGEIEERRRLVFGAEAAATTPTHAATRATASGRQTK
jgi:hypothetical protein